LAKIALLIGVSNYQPGFSSLPGTQTDIRAMQRVLQHPQMGGFDEVDLLPNPDKSGMELAIEKLLADRQRDDLVLLYFSGHGFKDDDGSLYFVTRTTEQRSPHQIYQSTAVPATVLQNWMSRSRCKRQVLVLDCCFSGAFAEGMKAKSVNEPVEIAAFGGEGRAVLTSSTATQVSFEQREAAVYTRYLVEGIETGAADTDNNGIITIDELHDYAKRKVQEAAPAMKPEIFAVKEGYTIVLAKAPVGDPKLEYRKEVEQLAQQRNGKLSSVLLRALDEKRRTLELSLEDVAVIQSEVLRPYREFEAKLQQYEQALTEALQQESPLTETMREDLKYLQKVLGLKDENIASIEARLPKAQQPRPRWSKLAPAAKTEMPFATTRAPEPVQLLQAPTSNAAPARRNNKPLIWVGGGVAVLSAIGISLSSLPPQPKPSVSPSDSRTTTPTSQMTAQDFFKRAFDEDKNGNKKGAIDDYTQAITLKPDYAEAYSNRGIVRADLGDRQAAIQDYNQVIKLKPDYADADNNRGSVRADLGDKQAAIQDYNQAIKLKPDFADADNNRGSVRADLGDKQAAIQDYNQAIKLKPDFADAYYNRGLARKALGDKQAAVQDYQKAADLYQQQRNTKWYQDALNQIKTLQ